MLMMVRLHLLFDVLLDAIAIRFRGLRGRHDCLRQVERGL